VVNGLSEWVLSRNWGGLCCSILTGLGPDSNGVVSGAWSVVPAVVFRWITGWTETVSDWQSQVILELRRFAALQDGSVRTAIAAMLLLGLACGLLGCFLVLRRLSLLGDSLGHAVLPGIALGFLVTWSKHPAWLFAGAMVAALLAGIAVVLVQRQTRLKPDVAMGVVLSAFFGFGLMLLSRIQSDPRGGQGGLTQFFYGQAAAISASDLALVGAVTLVIVGCVVAGYRQLLVTSFDESFATTIGVPSPAVHFLLLAMTALAIVISIQAVGVVLLSALLITPAATALLLAKRLPTALLLSAGLASVGGVLGLALSSLSASVWTGALQALCGLIPGSSGWGSTVVLRASPPTGPIVVLVLSLQFGLAFLMAPRHGLVPVWCLQQWRRYRAARPPGGTEVLGSGASPPFNSSGNQTSEDLS